jgi:hypothetical protein
MASIERSEGRTTACAAGAIVVLVILLLAATALPAAAETIGPAEITLHYLRFYPWWGDDGLTMLGYKVKSRGPVDAWILGLGECIQPEDALWWSTFQWVEEPIRGLRFSPSSRTEIFYLYLYGRWDLGPTSVAVVDEGMLYYGEVDGPICTGASIGLEVVSGANVGFPAITGSGRFESLSGTVLRVSSSTSGWTLDHSIVVSGPDGADEETIRRVFRMEVEPYVAEAGTNEIEISYALDFEETDFDGLPQGAYAISITYTLSAE